VKFIVSYTIDRSQLASPKTFFHTQMGAITLRNYIGALDRRVTPLAYIPTNLDSCWGSKSSWGSR
jgi:hypothetical protein